jgi:hypothetical protein
MDDFLVIWTGSLWDLVVLALDIPLVVLNVAPIMYYLDKRSKNIIHHLNISLSI